MSDRAILAATVHGAVYYLTAHPREWVLERGAAQELDLDEARELAAQYGGTIILLRQKREVRGEVLGVADGGRKC